MYKVVWEGGKKLKINRRRYKMKYTFECDKMDGLVLIDEYYLDKFNNEQKI